MHAPERPDRFAENLPKVVQAEDERVFQYLFVVVIDETIGENVEIRKDSAGGERYEEKCASAIRPRLRLSLLRSDGGDGEVWTTFEAAAGLRGDLPDPGLRLARAGLEDRVECRREFVSLLITDNGCSNESQHYRVDDAKGMEINRF